MIRTSPRRLKWAPRRTACAVFVFSPLLSSSSSSCLAVPLSLLLLLLFLLPLCCCCCCCFFSGRHCFHCPAPATTTTATATVVTVFGCTCRDSPLNLDIKSSSALNPAPEMSFFRSFPCSCRALRSSFATLLFFDHFFSTHKHDRSSLMQMALVRYEHCSRNTHTHTHTGQM